MPGRYISPGYLAGAALAALAHTGLVAAVLLAGESGVAGPVGADTPFIVTLVDEPDVKSEPELTAEPEPVPEPVVMPDPVAPAPVEPLPARPEPVAEADIPEPEHAEPPPPVRPANAEAGAPPVEPVPAVQAVASQPVSEPGVEMIDASVLSESPELPPEAGASGGPAGAGDDGRAEMAAMDAYLRQVRLRLAQHAPRGVAGARNCEVEFQLSRSGEVVFVGLQASSGSHLYDRRCLKSVTSAVPFPTAPPGASGSDLHFTIVMKQRR